MKRILALLLCSIFCLTGCGKQASDVASTLEESVITISEDTASESQSLEENADVVQAENLNFTSLNDPELLQYVDDNLCAELENTFEDESYEIENIDSIYISKEYLEELSYNSKENVYFGYTLSEILEQWSDTKYIFTVDDNGKTIVQSFQEYDDTYDKALINVAIGTGVILTCVTLSVITAGVGLEEVSAIFVSSAKESVKYALAFAGVESLMAALVVGAKTGDFDETLKSEASEASKGFMWGAIIGAVKGATNQTYILNNTTKKIANAVTSKDSVNIGIESENYVQKIIGGEQQVSYLNGERVEAGVLGATRPDIVKETKNGLTAYEVKNYDLKNNLISLKKELKRQIENRVKNLPSGSSQEIILVTKGRNYSKEFIKEVIQDLQDYLFDSYGGIVPIKAL